MVKFFKKIVTMAIFSALGYLGYKIFRIVKATLDLDKVLPQYLENVYGEKPTINTQLTLGKVILTAAFSPDLFQKEDELKTAIGDYVKDFYPAICPKYLEVVVTEQNIEDPMESKPVESEEKPQGKGWTI